MDETSKAKGHEYITLFLKESDCFATASLHKVDLKKEKQYS